MTIDSGEPLPVSDVDHRGSDVKESEDRLLAGKVRWSMTLDYENERRGADTVSQKVRALSLTVISFNAQIIKWTLC
jgi:hypothetical protein